MPHELRGLQDQPHEVFTYILTAGAFVGLLIVVFVIYMRWKHPGKSRAPKGGAPPRAKRRRR